MAFIVRISYFLNVLYCKTWNHMDRIMHMEIIYADDIMHNKTIGNVSSIYVYIFSWFWVWVL